MPTFAVAKAKVIKATGNRRPRSTEKSLVDFFSMLISFKVLESPVPTGEPVDRRRDYCCLHHFPALDLPVADT